MSRLMLLLLHANASFINLTLEDIHCTVFAAISHFLCILYITFINIYSYAVVLCIVNKASVLIMR